MSIKHKLILLLWSVAISFQLVAQETYQTDYLKIAFDNKGFITSMKGINTGTEVEFASATKPSPLLCLYSAKKAHLFKPTSATIAGNQINLTYENGSVATVEMITNKKYFRFTLKALTNRAGIDVVQWGPFNTNINKIFGDLIGVARDTSAAVNYAVGAFPLDERMEGGEVEYKSQEGPYTIHSSDGAPLPNGFAEGVGFRLTGDGHTDTQFYDHKESYFRITSGIAATVDEMGFIRIAWNAHDYTKPQPGFGLDGITALPIELKPYPMFDYINSSIALWGGPDDIALLDILQNIVISERLPYITMNGKWIRDPARYIPTLFGVDNIYNNAVEYCNQLGIDAIQANDVANFSVDRGNEGFVDGRDFSRKPFNFRGGPSLSYKEMTDKSNPKGVRIGLHMYQGILCGTIDTKAPGNDSLGYLHLKILTKDICPDETQIEVDNPTGLNDFPCYMKIDGELIGFNGVSNTKPYLLTGVKRGDCGTEKESHSAGKVAMEIAKSPYGGSYFCLVPNVYLLDRMAEYYAAACHINGIRMIDWDGFGFTGNMGFNRIGLRFFRKFYDKLKTYGIDYVKSSGGNIAFDAWFYHNTCNIGGQGNMYRYSNREWGNGSDSWEGARVRDNNFANYFPASMGEGHGINASSDVPQYENLEALTVGVGASYKFSLVRDDVERCPNKDDIFKAIHTWENARAANAFPASIKKKLAIAERNWHLEEVDKNTWELYAMPIESAPIARSASVATAIPQDTWTKFYAGPLATLQSFTPTLGGPYCHCENTSRQIRGPFLEGVNYYALGLVGDYSDIKATIQATQFQLKEEGGSVFIKATNLCRRHSNGKAAYPTDAQFMNWHEWWISDDYSYPIVSIDRINEFKKDIWTKFYAGTLATLTSFAPILALSNSENITRPIKGPFLEGVNYYAMAEDEGYTKATQFQLKEEGGYVFIKGTLCGHTSPGAPYPTDAQFMSWDRLPDYNYPIVSINKINVLSQTLHRDPNYPPTVIDIAPRLASQPVVAYALRRLGSGYFGKAIKVSRAQDDQTADIGFKENGDLDLEKLQDFAKNTDAFVATWYDQTGNGNDAIQTDKSKQPKIVSGGIVALANNKPTIMTSAAGFLQVNLTAALANQAKATKIVVAASNVGDTPITIDQLGDHQLDIEILSSKNLDLKVDSAPIVVNSNSLINTNSLMTICAERTGAKSSLDINGIDSQSKTTDPALSDFGSQVVGYIGTNADKSNAGSASFSEYYLFNNSINEVDKQAIQNNQKVYFTIQ